MTLHLLARLEERRAAEAELLGLCRRHDVAEPICAELVSAFIEAFNNVVLHAYKGRDDGTVEVVLKLSEDALTIELHDQGQGFDPHAVPPPPTPQAAFPEGLREGGYGVHIIRSVMSEVSYYRDGARNVLRMTRQFPSNPHCAS